ncbi:hypothetical protein N9049_01340 [bacterium]|nr:hypothetical protein [bacterium]
MELFNLVNSVVIIFYRRAQSHWFEINDQPFVDKQLVPFKVGGIIASVRLVFHFIFGIFPRLSLTKRM